MENERNIDISGASKECPTEVNLLQSDNEEQYQSGSLFKKNQENAVDVENTQMILSTPLKKKKKLSMKKSGQEVSKLKKQQKVVQENPLYKFLDHYWNSELTVLLMDKFIRALRDHCMKNQLPATYKVVQVLTKLMKAFVLEHGNLDLTNISHAVFEKWALNAGLSTTYGLLQQMDAVHDLDETFFKILSQIVIEHEKEELEDEEDQPEACLSLPNTSHTSTLSTTAHTRRTHVAVGQSSSSANIQQEKQPKPSTSKESTTQKNKTSDKLMNLKKRPQESEVDTSDEEIQPFKRQKKVTFKPRVSTEEEVSDNSSNGEQSQGFVSLLDDIVQAHSSTMGTSKILQSICVQDNDESITLKSLATSGRQVMKFDLYPYRSCIRNQKQDWWRHAEFRSTVVVCGKNSPVAVLAEKLKKELIKAMMANKGVEVERKPLGLKRGWKGSS